ncbi:MAG TPA: hypothetical protein VEX18_02810 [Polyangiaceae bacterium]|nr:hypothetical protein [Polyangiaceae bacterium]
MLLAPAHRSYLLAAGLILACGSNEPSEPPANPGGGSDATSGAGAGSGGAMAGFGTGGAPASGGLGGGGLTSTAGTTGSSGRGGGGSGGTAGAAVACESEDPALTFEENCLACAETDCERCLCTECVEQLQACAETSGCPEILACIQASQCTGVDCYCGTFDAVACAGGQSNGPCKSAILAAPGSREPSLLDRSAGPASDAAVAISDCAQPGASCAESCPAGG